MILEVGIKKRNKVRFIVDHGDIPRGMEARVFDINDEDGYIRVILEDDCLFKNRIVKIPKSDLWVLEKIDQVKTKTVQFSARKR